MSLPAWCPLGCKGGALHLGARLREDEADAPGGQCGDLARPDAGRHAEVDGVEGAASSTPALLELIKGGDLGFACFFKFMGKPLPAPPAFDDMDADGDGELTAEEIFEALSKNNPDVTLEKVQEIVAKADADGNGGSPFSSSDSQLEAHDFFIAEV